MRSFSLDLDLAAAFWQSPIKKGDEQKTAFRMRVRFVSLEADAFRTL